MVEFKNTYKATSRSSNAGSDTKPASNTAGPRTVDELIRIRATELPSTPLVSYPHHGLDYSDYTAQQLDQYAFHVAKQYAPYLQPRTSSSEKAVVVGLLGLSSLDYLITAMAVSKLGHTALHLSTRISHEAYINLLTETETVVLLVDDAMHDVATRCRADMPGLDLHPISIASTYIRPVQHKLDTNLTPNLDLDVEQKTVAWIIHSSGSTGLPKPIYQTQRAAINNYKGNMDMRGFITLPLFHAHGISSTYRAIYSGKQIHIYNAMIPLTKQYLKEVMRRYRFEIFYGVPYVLTLLAEDEEGVQLLSRCKIVMFGGSACPDELGETLVENGVNLVSHWGSTETGQLMTSFRPAGDKAWNYLRPSDVVKPYLRMEDRGEGLFEAVCLPGWPSKVAANRPDGSYAMKDLFTKHPKQDWWKYYGRLDDTIVLVNGEKAMPLPIEGAARQHSSVSEAVVFGKGRDRLGLALVRAPKTLSTDSGALAKAVIDSFERVQSEMPGYARISSDMVLVLDADIEYPRTDKGTVIRAKFYKRFEKEIDDLYQAVNQQSGSLQLSQEELREFIRKALQGSCEMEISNDNQDFFNAGMDSLQATKLRAAIVKAIDVGHSQLGINIAFEHPTISNLATYLYNLRTGVAGQGEEVSVEDEMQRLIGKYSTFEPHKAQPQQPEANSIVLTGVTGSLGAHIATILTQDTSIETVYCLIRASTPEEAEQRLQKSLLDRGLNSIPQSIQSKLVALPANLSLPDLGLAEETINTITSSLKAIIHSAWSVNFNLGLSSFEDCIQGVHNLIQLALSTTTQKPASFNFCSSVSTVMRTPTNHIPELVPDLSCAQNMGYAQSKLVTEHLCLHTARKYNLPTSVLRIGQIIGDTKLGIWNKQEAIPTMMQSAKTIGALPTLDENVRWLPVDVVAQSCVDIALQDRKLPEEQQSAGCDVYNIINPHTVHWTRDLLPLLKAQGLVFDELPVREWLARLQASNQDPSVNAPIKLLAFWMGKYDKQEVPEQKKLEYTWTTSNTAAASHVSSIAHKKAVLKVVSLSLDFFREKCW